MRIQKVFSFMYRHQRDPIGWKEVEDETAEEVQTSWATLAGAMVNDDAAETEPGAASVIPGAVAGAVGVASSDPSGLPSSSSAPKPSKPKPLPKRLPAKHKAHAQSTRATDEDGIPTGVGLFAGGG